VAAVVVASELGRAQRWIGEQDTVRLRFSGSCLRLSGSKGSWELPILKETFPAYRDLIDNLPAPATQVVAPGRALLSALGDDPAARVDLIAGDGGLTVRSSAREQAAITVPAEVVGDPMMISFQFSTLHPAIRAALGPDVLLRISRPDQPVVVRSADDGDFTTLAMPVPPTHDHGANGESAHQDHI
jgi:DNA polymerase III sliding clamp (beta) subunit (PCNA family)